jgi:CbiX
MRIRLAVGVVLLGVLLPGLAVAGQGILLLADEGKPEWKTKVAQLAATVDKQKPAEIAFWSTTNANLQAAVDRLIHRGVSEIVAIPLFIASPPSELSSRVKSSVPIRVTAPLNADPVAADIVLGRAQEISSNPAGEVLVLISHRSTPGGDKRWVPDLPTIAQRLNLMRRFAAIVSATVPSDASQASARDIAQLRQMFERQIAMGRRILVVPVLTSYGEVESAVKEQFQGLEHQVARSALMPDDRLVAWILSRAQRN